MPRPARRLLAALIVLAVLDQFVPSIRDRLEVGRYDEPGEPTRFENSDFFGVGPMVQYLREHPKGSRPRTIFLGNSSLFGYGLDVRDAIPAVYERLSPGERVLNGSINGLDINSAYLIAKALVDSCDTVFLLNAQGHSFNPVLVRLIPVDESDLRRFNVPAAEPSPLAPLMRWRLYQNSYRLQAAVFGTSTRQYLYLHKGELVRRAGAWIRGRDRADDFTPAERSPNLPTVTTSVPISRSPGDVRAQLAQANGVIVDLAELFQNRGKRVVLIQLTDYVEYLPAPLVEAFNARFAPHAAIVIVDASPSARVDRMHFTRDGAAAAARALRGIADDLR